MTLYGQPYITGTLDRVRALAEALGIEPQVLHDALRKSGLRVTRAYLGSEDVEALERMVLEGQTLTEIAAALGCTRELVRQRIWKFGLRGAWEEHSEKRRAAEYREKEAVRQASSERCRAQNEARKKAAYARVLVASELWKAGASVEDIGAAIGLKGYNSTQGFIHRSRCLHPDLFPRRREKYAGLIGRAAMLWDEDIPVAEMAKRLGIANPRHLFQRIAFWRRKFPYMFPHRRGSLTTATNTKPPTEAPNDGHS